MSIQQLITPHSLDSASSIAPPPTTDKTEIQKRVQRYLLQAGLGEADTQRESVRITAAVFTQHRTSASTDQHRFAISLAIAHIQDQLDSTQRLPNRSVPTECWQAMVKASDSHRPRRHRRTRLLISLGQSLLRLPKPTPSMRTS